MLGCRIFGVFYGALIYADDIFLLSASRTGLQEMVRLCHQFATKLNLKFGTHKNPSKSKTKCIIFSRNKKHLDGIKEVTLDGHKLPWVTQVNHLGHVLQQDNSMSIDINAKRGLFIGRINFLLQEFHYVTPDVLLKFVQTYACNIYGSNTWDLFSSECQRLFTSYNVAVRTILKLPRTTHRYLLESLTDFPHLFVQLIARFVKFSKSLLENRSFEVRFLSRACISIKWSLLSRSLVRIAELINFGGDVTDLTAQIVKQKLVYAHLPYDQRWRVVAVVEGKAVSDALLPEEASEILNLACTS